MTTLAEIDLVSRDVCNLKILDAFMFIVAAPGTGEVLISSMRDAISVLLIQEIKLILNDLLRS